jgi:L-fuconolactonase
MTDPLFDTHAHLISDDWERYRPKALRPDMPQPKRTDYTVTAEALIADMDRHRVPYACVVQRGHLYGYDNSYVIDSGLQFPGRLLPVVILDAQDPETPADFTDMVRHRGVRGIRLANIRPSHLDTAWMSSPATMDVWRACADLQVPMTLIVFHNQLGYVLPLVHVIAKMFPTVPITIDHLGTMYGATHVELAWAREAGLPAPVFPPAPDFGIDSTIRLFEDTPNVLFKLTEVNLDRMDIEGVSPARVIRRLADIFGAERLIWGSDVGQSLRWNFADKVRMARESASLLDPRERALFLHDNAARIYLPRVQASPDATG